MRYFLLLLFLSINFNTVEAADPALHFAIQNNQMHMVKHLIEERGFSPNIKAYGGTPALHWAIEHNRIQMIQFLLDHRADINKTNYDGFRPLHIATFENNTEAAKLLFQYGVDANTEDKFFNITSLHLASMHGHQDIAKLLIEQGANVDARNKDTETPLYNASKYNRLEAVKVLVEAGADVNAKNNIGDTPLHVAESGSIINWLIQNSSDIDINNLNELKQTPLDIALQRLEQTVRQLSNPQPQAYLEHNFKKLRPRINAVNVLVNHGARRGSIQVISKANLLLDQINKKIKEKVDQKNRQTKEEIDLQNKADQIISEIKFNPNQTDNADHYDNQELIEVVLPLLQQDSP